jgi:excinuclease ABC subunit A
MASASAPNMLEVKLIRGAYQLSVADVLDLTVSEACVVFSGDPAVTARLQPIVDVGLEYVKLGQPVPTLSAAARRNA